MALTTRAIVAENGMADIIMVHQSRVEDLLLPLQGAAGEGSAADQLGMVDLIVSEWMGTMLVFEFMIESGEGQRVVDAMGGEAKAKGATLARLRGRGHHG